jgi:L-fucose isomerase-like protein
VVVLTGGTEQQVLRAAAARPEREPVVVVAHPWHNSLAAALEAVARLHQDGRPSRIVYLDGEPVGRTALAEAVHDADVARRLRRLRIGAVGTPSDWLVASSPAPATVRDAWGPEIVPVDMADALRTYEQATAGAGARLAAAMVAGATKVLEADAPAIAAAARVHPVLAELVRRHRLDALTVRCFDLVSQLGTSGCLALAELNDTGVTAGCEGDLPSTVAMVWTRMLLGETPWMANPAQLNLEQGRLLLAHCTVARSLTNGYRIRSHFESELGAAIAGSLSTGPVTLVRIGGRRLERCWIAEATSVAQPIREGLCRTQLTVELPRPVLEGLLAAPLGNHLVVVPGHHHDRLARWRWTRGTGFDA